MLHMLTSFSYYHTRHFSCLFQHFLSETTHTNILFLVAGTLWFHFKSIDNWWQTWFYSFRLSFPVTSVHLSSILLSVPLSIYLAGWFALTHRTHTDFRVNNWKRMCVCKSYWILNRLEKHHMKINSWFKIDRNTYIWHEGSNFEAPFSSLSILVLFLTIAEEKKSNIPKRND